MKVDEPDKIAREDEDPEPKPLQERIKQDDAPGRIKRGGENED